MYGKQMKVITANTLFSSQGGEKSEKSKKRSSPVFSFSDYIGWGAKNGYLAPGTKYPRYGSARSAFLLRRPWAVDPPLAPRPTYATGQSPFQNNEIGYIISEM